MFYKGKFMELVGDPPGIRLLNTDNLIDFHSVDPDCIKIELNAAPVSPLDIRPGDEVQVSGRPATLLTVTRL